MIPHRMIPRPLFAASLSLAIMAARSIPALAREGPVRVASPNGEIELQIAVEPDAAPPRGSLSYRAQFRGRPVIVDSALGLDVEGQPPLFAGLAPVKVEAGGGDETYRVPAGKSNPIRDHYRSARIEVAESGARQRRLVLEARAYDDGVAFRYLLPEQPALRHVHITRERTEFRFAKDATTYPLVLRDFVSSYEDDYQKRTVSGLHPDWLIALPLLAEVPGAAWVAIAEAHIENFAGMYLRHSSDANAPMGPPHANALTAQLAPRQDRPEVAVVGTTPLASPWRVVMLGDEPGRLVESNLLLNLNPPSAIEDTSWIRPGKSAWDWWSGTVADDVAFEPGMNTDTMKHYIDFAAESGFPYMLIDAGWSRRAGRGEPADLTSTSPAIDMPAILQQAKHKGVRVWLWAHWTSVDRQMDEAFPRFEDWGIAGVKIDFMDRDDQGMVDFYHRVLRKAAEHHLMIDFHGAYKPDGIERTYPNLMTREGVMGLEYLKWSARITPEHNCTLPFTRMLAGPMDYTPGGFRHVTREAFEPRSRRPMVLGTRAHQLALFVVFESHLQVVADSPGSYRGDAGTEAAFAFLRHVPASWDETRVLGGRPMEFIAIARRSGDDWFVGCLTDWDERDLELPLDFLGEGRYGAEIYADPADAHLHPDRTAIRRQEVGHTTRLKLHLAPGGGAALRIRPDGG